MSILKFNLTKKHVKLVRHIDLEDLATLITAVGTSETPLDRLDHLIEVAGVILFGRPENFDPLNENPFNWSEAELEEIQTLLVEVPTAADIVLNAKTFKPGRYKTKYHDRNWRKVKE